MLDQVENRVLLIINNALGECLALHGERAGSLLPDDVGGLPCANAEGHTAGVDAEIEGKVAQGGNPRGPQETDLPGRAPDGCGWQLGR